MLECYSSYVRCIWNYLSRSNHINVNVQFQEFGSTVPDLGSEASWPVNHHNGNLGFSQSVFVYSSKQFFCCDERNWGVSWTPAFLFLLKQFQEVLLEFNGRRDHQTSIGSSFTQLTHLGGHVHASGSARGGSAGRWQIVVIVARWDCWMLDEHQPLSGPLLNPNLYEFWVY